MVFAILSISTLWINCPNQGKFISTDMASHTEHCRSALRPQAYYQLTDVTKCCTYGLHVKEPLKTSFLRINFTGRTYRHSLEPLSLSPHPLFLSSRTPFFFLCFLSCSHKRREPILHWRAEPRGSLASQQRMVLGFAPTVLRCQQAEQRTNPRKPGEVFPLLNPTRTFRSAFHIKCCHCSVSPSKT